MIAASRSRALPYPLQTDPFAKIMEILLEGGATYDSDGWGPSEDAAV
jgi:hypothetical protein